MGTTDDIPSTFSVHVADNIIVVNNKIEKINLLYKIIHSFVFQ